LLTIPRWLLLVAVAALSCAPSTVARAADPDPTTPTTPAPVVASIVASGTTAQEAAAGAQYASPLQVLVRDTAGLPVAGATVTFALGSGATGAGASFLGGGAQATATSSATGIATSPPFVANTSPGRFVATASTADVSAVVPFSLLNHSSATTITATWRSTQRATVGTRFRHRLQARVLDAAGQPIEGATVTFAIAHDAGGAGAGASFPDGGTQATALTDAEGRASSPRLIATSTAGAFGASASTPAAARQATFRLRSLAGAPATIKAGAASGQLATAASRFAIPFAVTVTDANANPVAGAVVVFSAPRSGASGRFGTAARRTVRVRTGSDGIAVAPGFTANGTVGGYALIARVAGTRLRTAFALVNRQAV
jgi:adhesin/invasin